MGLGWEVDTAGFGGGEFEEGVDWVRRGGEHVEVRRWRFGGGVRITMRGHCEVCTKSSHHVSIDQRRTSSLFYVFDVRMNNVGRGIHVLPCTPP